MMTSRKSTVFMLFGIIIGLCFGIIFKNYRALELVKRCSSKFNLSDRHPLKIINLSPDDTVLNSQNNLLFVGVMTAKDFLKGRARAVFDTWGKDVPGRLAFFSSEGSRSNDLPVVALKGVDDRYPPQKKSFRMLYYMYEHYINRFEWFARADDDVYINTRKLEKFLRSIDSTKPQFIGQAGRGNSEEFGLLSLEFDENFCMGGPGVILSRETLKRVAPHIPTCLKNLYSTHEDVEVGRCVQKFAGIPCTWNYEMQTIFHHNSSGRNAFTGKLKSKEIHNAITLHPVKKAPLMYRLHSYMQGLHAQELRQEALLLHRDISAMKEFLSIKETGEDTNEIPKFDDSDLTIFPSNKPGNEKYYGDYDILGTKPSLNKYRPESRDDLQIWNYISRSIYSVDQPNPKRRMESSMREGLTDVITEVMDYINNFSRQRGRIIEFRELLYGYSRVNPMYGQDLILDLLLIYKKYRGKKMTVPVRRHLYVQRAFTDYYVKEMEFGAASSGMQSTKMDNLKEMISSKMRNFWENGIGKISKNLPISLINQNSDTSKKFSHRPRNEESPSTIVFVLSLFGRFQTFLRFLKNYELVCLKHSETKTELLVTLFQEKNVDLLPYYNEIEKLQRKYPERKLNHITIQGKFSRGIALNSAARSHYIHMNDIIFFIDVDMTFNKITLDRIRMNTIKHKQVYLPVVFSQYNPKRWANPSTTQHRSEPSATESPLDEIGASDLGYETGYFRQFGYGICAIYKSDVLHPDIDGFDTDITGWGLEDVKFLEKIIKLNQKPNIAIANTAEAESHVENNAQNNNKNEENQKASSASPISLSSTSSWSSAELSESPTSITLSIFRAPDPTLVHIYHDIYCDKTLDEAQYQMCLGTKANTLGSYNYIESLFINNRTIIDYISSINSNS